jgi:hypothetical protein
MTGILASLNVFKCVIRQINLILWIVTKQLHEKIHALPQKLSTVGLVFLFKTYMYLKLK